MRTCLRCETPMIEDLAVKVENRAVVGIDVREPGLLKAPLDTIKCAVCPQCGYVETYVDCLSVFQRLAQEKQ